MLRFAIAVGIASTLTACATAPQVFDFEKTRRFNASKDVVWDRLVRYFATNAIQIKTIEKASGVIYAERQVSRVKQTTYDERGPFVGGYADCGRDFMAMPESQSLSVNVYVRDEGPSRSSATVTAVFKESYVDLSGWDDAPPPRDCNSTGVLERQILDELGTG